VIQSKDLPPLSISRKDMVTSHTHRQESRSHRIQIEEKMRLLNAKIKTFEEFVGEIPPYAILSHTWGSDELAFKDIERNGYSPSRKIDGCCEQAIKDELEYVWIDTCCIDKSSSAELSEAINSMWDWYAQSELCYVYLSDVPPGTNIQEEDSAFSRSRWFTRGWTLQELISPRVVAFYDESWNEIGRKSYSGDHRDFAILLNKVTRIPSTVLMDRRPWFLRRFSNAQKMSWAARRTTTRVEDVAYSLLGLFGINMPLLYGEGARAFIRLQEEILKASDDESIFSWGFGSSPGSGSSLFASSPADFEHCGDMVHYTLPGLKPSHYTLTNKGLHFGTSICDFPIEGGTALARLNCSAAGALGEGKSLALPLVRSRENDMILSRQCQTMPILVPSDLFPTSATTVYVHRLKGHREDAFFPGLIILCKLFGAEATYNVPEIYPPSWRGVLLHDDLICQQQNLESQYQSILFLVDEPELPKYAVWLLYKFLLVDDELHPRQLECRAALVETRKTLAEVIVRHKEGLVTALNWQEVLDFGDAELRFEIDQRDISDHVWIVNIEVSRKQGRLKGKIDSTAPRLGDAGSL
jgi:hypothetical protein